MVDGQLSVVDANAIRKSAVSPGPSPIEIKSTHPCVAPATALRKKVLVSRNSLCPKKGTPIGGTKYFYRYRCDDRNGRMMPRETLRGMRVK